jgi:hypothetical protein
MLGGPTWAARSTWAAPARPRRGVERPAQPRRAQTALPLLLRSAVPSPYTPHRPDVMSNPPSLQNMALYRFSIEGGSTGTFKLNRRTETYELKMDPDNALGHTPDFHGTLGDSSYFTPEQKAAASEQERIKDVILARSTGIRNIWLVQELVVPKLAEGSFHPRIYRQQTGPSARKVYGREYHDNIVAFSSLQRKLQDLFRVLEPTPANGQAYGHELREVLILAATEVELLWKQVLKANHYDSGPKPRFLTINDYAKIQAPLMLDSWEVSLADYPGHPPIAPFQGWSLQKPSGTLGFYDSYNGTKHSRDTEFSRATLINAITSVAAVQILLGAQFGYRLGSFSHYEDGPGVFRWERRPVYPLSEQYIAPAEGEDWTPVDYPF